MSRFAPQMVDQATAQALQERPSWRHWLYCASNIVTAHSSRLANHRDKESCLPALLTCCNPQEDWPWRCGDLLYTVGAFSVNYGIGDVVLLNGEDYHAVLPLIPERGGKEAVRHSLVHFNRPKTEEWTPEPPPPPRRSARLTGTEKVFYG